MLLIINGRFEIGCTWGRLDIFFSLNTSSASHTPEALRSYARSVQHVQKSERSGRTPPDTLPAGRGVSAQSNDAQGRSVGAGHRSVILASGGFDAVSKLDCKLLVVRKRQL